MIEPTIDRWGGWNSNGLLAPWDPAKLAMDNYLPGLADGAAGTRSHDEDGALFYVPSNWGTEALVYDKEDALFWASLPSLGALFDPANQVVVRPHSALAAMGRWLEAQGKLPRPWLDGYTDMGAMVELWDIALAEAVKAKGNVVQFWSGENEANAVSSQTARPSACAGIRPATTCATTAMAIWPRLKARLPGTRASF